MCMLAAHLWKARMCICRRQIEHKRQFRIQNNKNKEIKKNKQIKLILVDFESFVVQHNHFKRVGFKGFREVDGDSRFAATVVALVNIIE